MYLHTKAMSRGGKLGVVGASIFYAKSSNYPKSALLGFAGD